MSVPTKRQLLTETWTGEVDALERALADTSLPEHVVHDCRVVFVEIPQDGSISPS